MPDYEIIILGGGPAGYMGALHAAQKGAKVALVEKKYLGGTCLNWGCIPTKTMVEGAHIKSSLEKGKAYGIEAKDVQFNLAGLVKKKNEVVQNLRDGIAQLIKANKIDFYNEEGKVTAAGKVKEITLADGKTISCEKLLLATGSQVAIPPIPGLDETPFLTSDSLLDLEEMPEELIVIGAGVIGLEMAGIFNSLGSGVTVVEMMDQILPGLDKELAQRARIFLKKKGINIETKAQVQRVEKTGEGKIEVYYQRRNKDTSVKGSHLLVATGRKPVYTGLEFIGEKKEVEVNEYLETKWEGIFAAGDLIGGYQLAHVAYHEGIVAVNNMLGDKEKVNYAGIPNCIFTDPQIAASGLSEEKAKEKGYDYETVKFPFSALGKAVASSDPEGMIKIIFTKEKQTLLGIHIVGREATEIIHHGAGAIRMGQSVDQLAKTIFAHPTYSEGLGEAYHMSQGHFYHTSR